MICGHDFGAVETLENRSAEEKNHAECREKTHQPTHVVSPTEKDDKHVVRNNQAAKSGELPRPSSAGVVL